MNITHAAAAWLVSLLPEGASDLAVGSAALLGILIALIGVAALAITIVAMVTDTEDWQ